MVKLESQLMTVSSRKDVSSAHISQKSDNRHFTSTNNKNTVLHTPHRYTYEDTILGYAVRQRNKRTFLKSSDIDAIFRSRSII